MVAINCFLPDDLLRGGSREKKKGGERRVAPSLYHAVLSQQKKARERKRGEKKEKEIFYCSPAWVENGEGGEVERGGGKKGNDGPLFLNLTYFPSLVAGQQGRKRRPGGKREGKREKKEKREGKRTSLGCQLIVTAPPLPFNDSSGKGGGWDEERGKGKPPPSSR